MSLKGDLSLIHPIGSAFEITPNDSGFLPKVTRAIYVGESGDLAVLMTDLTEVTFVGLAAGVFHPIRVLRVYSTGTTATGIIGGV